MRGATSTQPRGSHPAGSRLRVRLLGGFDVEVDGRPVPVTAWRLRKASELVKLLALFQFVEILNGTPEILRLDKSEIRLPVFSGFALHP